MSSDKPVRNFLLCLGVQKAGTTWLHDYLDGHTQTDMGFTKEYHILDTLSPESGATRLFEKRERAIKLLERKPDMFSGSNYGFWKRFAFYLDIETYYDYYTGLLQVDGVRLSGDMTPDNGLASVEMLQALQAGFLRRNIGVKPLILLRDPVERCWSAVRMGKRNAAAGKSSKPQKGDGDEATLLRQSYNSKGRSYRTRYEIIFSKIEQVFSRDEYFSSFYETLFTTEEIKRFCEFAQIDFEEPKFSKRLNVSEKASEISDDLRREVAQEFKATYYYCADRWGRELILNIWPNAHFVL